MAFVDGTRKATLGRCGLDRDGGRHLQDLMDLAPTADELRDAAQWTRTQDPSEGFRFNLHSLLTQLGHGNRIT